MVVYAVIDEYGDLEELFLHEEKAKEYVQEFGNSGYTIESWIVRN